MTLLISYYSQLVETFYPGPIQGIPLTPCRKHLANCFIGKCWASPWNWKEFEEESKNILQVKEIERQIFFQTFPLNWGSNDALWEANVYQSRRSRRKNEDFHFMCNWPNIRLKMEARNYSWENKKDEVLDIFWNKLFQLQFEMFSS